jgi:hypothetical protein
LSLLLPVLFHENVIDTFTIECSLILRLSGMCWKHAWPHTFGSVPGNRLTTYPIIRLTK